MGFTRKILAHKQLNDKSVFYTDKFIIELSESMHIHFRNLRLCLSLEEWRIFAQGVITSYWRWLIKGKPHYQPPINNWKTFKTKINPIAGQGKDSVIKNELSIELSQHADYIHFHFRNIRYEFSVDEFLEFAEGICQARDQIKNIDIMKDYPKRIGFHHILQARGRVTPAKNSGHFTTHDSRFPSPTLKTYDTLIFDEQTNEWKKQVNYQQNLKLLRRKPYLATRILRKIIRPIFSLLNSIFKFF